MSRYISHLVTASLAAAAEIVCQDVLLTGEPTIDMHKCTNFAQGLIYLTKAKDNAIAENCPIRDIIEDQFPYENIPKKRPEMLMRECELFRAKFQAKLAEQQFQNSYACYNNIFRRDKVAKCEKFNKEYLQQEIDVDAAARCPHFAEIQIADTFDKVYNFQRNLPTQARNDCITAGTFAIANRIKSLNGDDEIPIPRVVAPKTVEPTPAVEKTVNVEFTPTDEDRAIVRSATREKLSKWWSRLSSKLTI